MRHFLQQFFPTLLLATFLLLTQGAFTSCRNSKNGEAKVLLVSIEPLRYVVEAIAGDKFSVETLMPRGASPETYEPTPRQMRALSGATLVFRAGTLGFERTSLEKMVGQADGLKLVSLSDGISQICENGSSDHSSDSTDPHIWTSPENLHIMARNVCKALSEVDAANADYYAHRLEAFNTEMNQLDASLRQALAGTEGASFLIHHPALGYFARQYGLHQISVEREGKEPSVAGLQEIVDECRGANVKTIFISEEHNGRVTRRIAETLGLPVTEINPLAHDVPAELLKIAKALHHEPR